MNWKDLGRKVAAAGLPALGATLAGPTGAVVGRTIAAKLGMPEADPVALMQAVSSGDPETMVALAKIEAERSTAELEIAAADVEDARRRHKEHWLPPVLTIVLLALVAAFAVALFTLTIPPENRDMLNFVLGNFFGWAGAAITYWIGSSRGSVDKSRELARTRD